MQAPRDQNSIPTLLGVSNADGVTPVAVYADPTTHRLLVDLPNGTGTVTSVSVVTANGVSGSVATATTTPAITLTLGAIAPTTVNGLTVTTTTGTFTLTSGKTLGVSNTLTLAGTDSTVMTFPSTSATIARTDAANTFTGASTASAWVLTSPTVTTKINPTSDDGAPLGDTTHNFSDLFLASGAVVNYANSNVVLTHTSGVLTLGTGNLIVSNAGSASGSVVTIDGSQTLTSKTLTTPTLTKPVLNARNQTAQTYTPAGGGTSTLDLSLADQHYVTFPAGNITLALSNDTNNQIFLVSLTQDSVGSRTVTFFTTIKWAGGVTPTLTTTANKRDTFGFIRTGSGTYDGFVIGQNI